MRNAKGGIQEKPSRGWKRGERRERGEPRSTGRGEREEKEGGRKEGGSREKKGGKKEGKGEAREERDDGLEERRRTKGTVLETERSEIREEEGRGKEKE